LFYRLKEVGFDWGDIWTDGEQKLILQEAFARLREDRRPAPPPSESTHQYVWESDFTWREELAILMQDHPDYQQYHSVFLASEIMGLNPYKNAKEFEEITHSKKSANWKWLNRMKNDEAFQGWLKDTRAKLHERFVAQKLRAAGWQVQEQPEFDWQGLHYQEDLYATRGDKIVWINCKCGSGNRTYVADEYKTTYILKNQANAETYIVYLDLEDNVHEVYAPDDRFSVGSGHAGLSVMKPVDGEEASTPILLLRALAGPVVEATEERAEACTEPEAAPDVRDLADRVLDAATELARSGGVKAAEQALAKEWGADMAARIMVDLQHRLKAEKAGAKTTKRKSPAHTRRAHGRGVRGRERRV
jgi:hypothetical protein